MDRRGIDQRRDAPAVGDRQHDLLCAPQRRVAEHLGQREFVQGNLPPVGEPARHHLQQLLRRLARRAQTLDNPCRLPVERHRMAGPGIEDRHAHRRGVDQDLQVGPGALDVAVRARVGDRRRGLRREQHQDLFVRIGELPPVFLAGEIEVADMLAAMAHRRSHEGLVGQQVRGKAQRADVFGKVPQP